MRRAYVVTEGQTDADVLRRVLRDELVREVEFVAGGGRSAAESLARSLLASKQLPVVLVVDADTTDEQKVDEQLDFLRYYLDQGSGCAPFEVLAAVPEIETVLFEDQSLVERVTNHKFSEREWKIAKRQPKESLTTALTDRPNLVEHILDGVNEETLTVLRMHPLVRKLDEFLSSVFEGTP